MNRQLRTVNPSSVIEQIKQGGTQLISEQELLQKLAEDRPLRVKLGVDPTAPDLHLGHSVALAKMRQFQDFGHQGVLIIGNFTSMVGDPTGRSTTRPVLTSEQVAANAETYRSQAFKILDPDRTETIWNADWLGKLTYIDVIRLNSRVTLQQMLQREDFRRRIEEGTPVFLHELQYPVLQGWDSVVIRADVELGGTEQLFNIMVGRSLQKEHGQPQQVACLLPILEGLDGVQKMSKSLGNYIGLTESAEAMFGKVMSVSDELMARYYQVLFNEPGPGGHPMEAKKALASRIVTRYHDAAAAKTALEEFERRFGKRDLESASLPEVPVSSLGNDLVSAIVTAYAAAFNLTRSRSDVRRLIEQGSVQWRGEKLTNPKECPTFQAGEVLKLDKTRAVRLV
ncbi:MAG TPA: tyrosine--tRNA ligase [Chthoniobacterales bacterium]|nr:tyrosine--tRNA ligase [Chthoniobacterales bacterium]